MWQPINTINISDLKFQLALPNKKKIETGRDIFNHIQGVTLVNSSLLQTFLILYECTTQNTDIRR